MSETEKYDTKIKFSRYKVNTLDKPCFHDGKYMVKRAKITSGYDALLRKWRKVKTEIEYLPMSTLGFSKEIEQTIYLKRIGYDPMLKPIELWIKIVRKIEVENKHNNIFLSQSCYRVFMTDIVRGVTVPIPMREIEKVEHIKVSIIEEKPLSEEEKTKLLRVLNDKKQLIKPPIYEVHGTNDYRMLVPTGSIS